MYNSRIFGMHYNTFSYTDFNISLNDFKMLAYRKEVLYDGRTLWVFFLNTSN